MKNKTETKPKAPTEDIGEEVTKTHTNSEMNDEEFDRYIDNIMAKESAEKKDEQQVEVQKKEENFDGVREDIKSLINVMNGFIKAFAAQQMPPVKQMPESDPKLDAAKKAQLYDMLMEKKKRNDAIRKNLFNQENDLKKTYADFDLKKLYNTDQVFKSELDKTGSVYAAYLKTLASNPAAVQSSAGRNFLENGAMPNLAAGSITTSPAGLPDKEFDEYIRNIMGQI